MRLWRPPTLILNASLGALALIGAGWAYHAVTASETTTTTTTSQQRTVTVSQGEVVATVSATGTVESANTASADFVTSGTVTSISVKVGDTVKKGQVLAKVDPTESNESLATAEANLDAAEESLDRAEDSDDDATIATAEAAVTSAKATVAAAKRAVTGTVLKAPMAGTVTSVNGSVGGSSGGSSSSGSSGTGGSSGSSTSSSSSGFIEIADLSEMQVSASFAEADATKLKAGQTATVTWSALSGTTAEGKVATISPTASTSNNVNSYAVVVSLDSPPTGARLGQTTTVEVTTASATDVIRVPTTAVTTRGTRHTVTLLSNGQTTVQQVEIGVEGDSYIEITSGLTVGQQVQITVTTSSNSSSNSGDFPGGGFGGGGIPGGGAGPGAGGGR